VTPRRLVRVLLVVAVLAVLAVGLDRLAKGLAEGEVEGRLASSGLQSPVVDVLGFPFLTQAARNRFATVDLSATSYTSGVDRLVGLRGRLSGATLSGDGVRAERARFTAVVPFATVERRLPQGDLRISAAGAQVRVTRSIEVLGRSFRVSATARVRLAGSRLVVEPTAVELPNAGPLDDVVSDAARGRVRLDYPVEGLPPGFRVERVDVVADGFRVSLTGRDVLLQDASGASAGGTG
jgi:hypothetical protein